MSSIFCCTALHYTLLCIYFLFLQSQAVEENYADERATPLSMLLMHYFRGTEVKMIFSVFHLPIVQSSNDFSGFQGQNFFVCFAGKFKFIVSYFKSQDI